DMGIARDGVTARAILAAGERHGLAGRALRVEPRDLALLPRGAILHWRFSHFVVLDRVCRGGARVVDPAGGPRLVSAAELDGAFTGVALVLEPTGGFQPGARRRRGGLRRLAGELGAERATFTRAVVVSLLLRMLALALPLLTGVVVDQVVPRSDRNLLLVAGLGVMMLVGLDALAQVVRAHLLLHLRTRLDTRMTVGFLEHLVSLPYAFFQTRSTGDLLLRVGSNATVREILTSSTLSGLLDGCFVLLYAIIVFCLSPGLGMLVLLLAGLHASVFLLARGRYRQLMVEDLEAQSRAQGSLV